MDLKVRGVGRDADNARAISVYLSERPTDDELRQFHDFLRTWRATREAAAPAAPPPPVDDSQRVLVGGGTEADRPDYRDVKPNGQQKDYVVLSAAERAKGFLRPVRRTYQHVGLPGPKFPLVDLTDEQKAAHGDAYVKYEPYPESMRPSLGRYWAQQQLDKIDKGCGTVTTMSQAIAETYARSPAFYGATFCCGCGKHLPVGADGEFIWDDGSNQRVGT